MDMASMLDASVLGRTKKAAIRFQGRTTTYGELQQLSLRAAALLRNKGIGAGDRVALMSFNTPGFLIAAFGAWRIGAVIVPINHKLQAPEIDYILDHAKVKLFLFDGSFGPTVDKCRHRCQRTTTDSRYLEVPFFDEALTSVPAGAFDRVADESVAEVLYTSGTTGKPKGCLHSHRNLLAQALTVVSLTSITEDEKMLISMPIWHSSPLNNWTIGSLLVGGTVVLLREYAPRAFLECIQAERTTATFCAPIALLAPLTAVDDFERFDLSSMTRWIYGGGPIGAEMANRLIAAYKSDRFLQVYGMTETGPLGTILHAKDAIRKAGSIGCNAGPGLEMKVLLMDGRPAGPGDIGEVHFRSHAMMLGYLDDEKATAEAFTLDGWYRSGDLVQVDSDGYYYVVDRKKDMIITGGENVYSKEVEDVLIPHPAIVDAAVVGTQHPHWGETVTAAIVLKPGVSATAQELQAYLTPLLAKYKIPRIYHFVDELPRTPSGKLKKHEIRQSLGLDKA